MISRETAGYEAAHGDSGEILEICLSVKFLLEIQIQKIVLLFGRLTTSFTPGP